MSKLDMEVTFKCDNCENVWNVSSDDIIRTVIDNIDIHFIYCSECKAVYITKCFDKYIRNCVAAGKNKDLATRQRLIKRSNKLVKKYTPIIKQMIINEGL